MGGYGHAESFMVIWWCLDVLTCIGRDVVTGHLTGSDTCIQPIQKHQM